ncbi:MAG: hypothetical protein HYU59_11745 [Magnetospirillum gryphiswaldense]|nr:hypothetical protein [Magnetospirillum gryphiswaldense]
MVKHAPPPTRFPSSLTAQAKSAAGPASTTHHPPPTKFGQATSVQAKSECPRGVHIPPPTKYAPTSSAQPRLAPLPHHVSSPPSVSAPWPQHLPRPAVAAIQPMLNENDMGYESFGDEGASDDEFFDILNQSKKKGDKKEAEKLHKKPIKKYYRAKKSEYRQNFLKKKLSPFKSNDLKTIVFDLDTGTPGANTNIIYIDSSDNAEHFQANTATAIKIALKKFTYKKKRIIISSGSFRSGSKSNTHSEMSLLYKKTGGKIKNVNGVLAGGHVTVDKPCCRMCYQWMVKSGAVVNDSTNFSTIANRQSFAWRNPFTGDYFSKKQVNDKSDEEILKYVNDLVP